MVLKKVQLNLHITFGNYTCPFIMIFFMIGVYMEILTGTVFDANYFSTSIVFTWN